MKQSRFLLVERRPEQIHRGVRDLRDDPQFVGGGLDEIEPGPRLDELRLLKIDLPEAVGTSHACVEQKNHSSRIVLRCEGIIEKSKNPPVPVFQARGTTSLSSRAQAQDPEKKLLAGSLLTGSGALLSISGPLPAIRAFNLGQQSNPFEYGGQ